MTESLHDEAQLMLLRATSDVLLDVLDRARREDMHGTGVATP